MRSLCLNTFFETFFRLVSYASLVLFIALTVLLVSTVFSRLGYLNFIGVSVVFSRSMEPSLKPGDMIVYASVNYTVGDVVVYCLTPSHCVVHRVVDFLRVDTVNGDGILVVAKGDNVETADSPVEAGKVRGRVVAVVLRELWIPLILALAAYSLYDISKTPIVGYSYAVLLAVGLSALVAIYATTQEPVVKDEVRSPIVKLSGVYFEPQACTLRIRYTGELWLTSAEVRVNSTEANAILVAEREVVVEPDPNLLGRAFEHGSPLLVEIKATLNHVGRLTGKYAALIGGVNPEISSVNGTLLVWNPNCFPLSLNVPIRYRIGDTWFWSNQTYIVEGFSQLVVEPPAGAEYAYVYVYWYNQGYRRWIGLPVRRG